MKSSLTFAILLLLSSPLHAIAPSEGIAAAPAGIGAAQGDRVIARHESTASSAVPVTRVRASEPGRTNPASAEAADDKRRSGVADPSAVALLGLGLLMLAALRRRASRE